VLPDGYEIRNLTIDDAPALAAAFRRNRDHLARWDPIRPASFYTDEGQALDVQGRLDVIDRGLGVSWVLAYGDEIVGRVNLNNVIRGVLQSCSVGYWTDGEHLGRGLATAMAEHAVAGAEAIGLHRVEAGTIVDNVASQGVLRRAGFTEYGMAEKFLYIAGGWQDHVLFQRILHDRPPGNPVP
jgi:ribosomal-protein-alanine N-acetyltransferase